MSIPTDVCYMCGSYEHLISECPKLMKCYVTNAMFPEGSSSIPQCYRCGNTGHLAKSCPETKLGSYETTKECYYCGKDGHIVKECPSIPQGGPPKVAGKGKGKARHIWDGSGTLKSTYILKKRDKYKKVCESSSDKICFACGRYGHVARDCDYQNDEEVSYETDHKKGGG